MRRYSVLCFLLLAAVGLCADEPEMEPKIQRIALFKNGLGYFVSQVTIPEKATSVKIGRFPIPSLGTFWITYPAEISVRSLVAGVEEASTSGDARTLLELLSGNAGHRVILYTSSTEKPVVEGTIVRVLHNERTPELPNPYVINARFSVANDSSYQPVQELVFVKNNDGTVVLNGGSIIRADFPDEDLRLSYASKIKRPQIRMELQDGSRGGNAEISYLAHGITWSPAYRFDISDRSTAHVSAQAIIVNEVADLVNVQADLITGFPNLQFADINSPIAMNQSLADFLRSLQNGRSQDQRGNMITQQASFSNVANYSEGAGIAYTSTDSGRSVEDLFLYPAGNLTLRRGESAYIPLFAADLAYERLYTWQIPDFVDNTERYGIDNSTEQKEEKVWNTCRITNKTKVPWTTAPAVFVKDGQIIGQDTANYTAVGAEAAIRINRALNVLADQQEFEVDRQRDAGHFYGTSYDLVKLHGELKVRNASAEPVTIEITKELSGEVQETAPVAKNVATPKGLRKANPHHILTWKIQIESRQEKNLTYNYSVYVHN